MVDADLDPFAQAEAAAAQVAAATGVERHDVAVVLGSGWSDAIETIGEVAGRVPFDQLDGFPPPSVAGHGGEVVSVTHSGGKKVLIIAGRVHLYEGHAPSRVVHGVRMAAAAGCQQVILTNACGSIDPGHNVGDLVMVRDHLNFTGASPLTGAHPPEPYGSRFVDLSDCYSARLRGLAADLHEGIGEGVYVGVHGPQYETPAEIAMFRLLGAELVGMSTVLEAIAAHHAGAEVAAIAMVTNQAAGTSDEILDHLDVLSAGKAAVGDASVFLSNLIGAV